MTLMRGFLWVIALVVALSIPHVAQACEGRSIEDDGIMGGTVCVPKSPQRIVILDPGYSLGMAIELDLPVVGAPLMGMSDHALRTEAEARGIGNLGSFMEPSLETIIALRPDLIIGSAALGEPARIMGSRIAPTVLIGSADWKDYYRTLAKIVGQEGRADALLAPFEARAASLRGKLTHHTLSAVRITPWDFQVYLDAPNAYAPFAVAAEAGVRRTAYETATEGPTVKRPDWEDLAQLDGDVLFYIVGGANNSDTSGRHEEVTGNPLWQMLPAVKAGRVYRVDAGTWMEFSGVAAANRVLDDLERYLAAP